MKKYIKVNGYSEMKEVIREISGEDIRGMAAGSRTEKYTTYFFKDDKNVKSRTIKNVGLKYYESDDIQPILEMRDE